MYQVGNIADTNVLNAIAIIEREYLQNIIGQHFLWSITDNASKEELLKYGADTIPITAGMVSLLAGVYKKRRFLKVKTYNLVPLLLENLFLLKAHRLLVVQTFQQINSSVQLSRREQTANSQ